MPIRVYSAPPMKMPARYAQKPKPTSKIAISSLL
jgi:hypothetical protein